MSVDSGGEQITQLLLLLPTLGGRIVGEEVQDEEAEESEHRDEMDGFPLPQARSEPLLLLALLPPGGAATTAAGKLDLRARRSQRLALHHPSYDPFVQQSKQKGV